MKRLYMIAGAAIALSACDNNTDAPVFPKEPIQISATIGESSSTRASNDKWSENDKIGITLVSGDKAMHLNMEYTIADGDGNFTGNPIYFYKPMTLTAYYPFIGKEGEKPYTGKEGDTPGIIPAVTTADNQTPDKQSEFDFLWAMQDKYTVVDNKPVVSFAFSHKMSKITLIFKSGSGIDLTKSKIVKYEIEGLILSGSFDTSTGECIADSADPESLDINLSDMEVIEGEALKPLIIFPQKPGSVTLHIYTDEGDDPDNLQHYSCLLNFSDGELKSGNNYQFDITVSKADLNVNYTIKEWAKESKVLDGGPDGNGAISAD